MNKTTPEEALQKLRLVKAALDRADKALAETERTAGAQRRFRDGVAQEYEAAKENLTLAVDNEEPHA